MGSVGGAEELSTAAGVGFVCMRCRISLNVAQVSFSTV